MYYADTYNEGTYVYDGTTFVHPFTSETPAIRYILDGDLGGTNAGEYVLLATPATNCCWSDGSTEQREYYWYINKALAEFRVGIKYPVTYGLDADLGTTKLAVTRPGSAKITIEDGEWRNYVTIDPEYSTTSDTVYFTFTGSDAGLWEGDVWFTVEEDQNYEYDTYWDNCYLTNVPIGASLNSTSWETISYVSNLGFGALFWSVGDTKKIAVNGYIGTVYVDDYYWAYILGFDHNSDVEGTGIHFQMGKEKSGIPIAFSDANSYDFFMNEEETNMTNWSGSYMRNTYCSDFYNCLSSDEVIGYIKSVAKYTGMGGAYTAEVEYTDELIFIPSEYEVFGSTTYSSAEEASYQQKYSYFTASSRRVRYDHDDIGSTTRWWLRSPDNTSPGNGWCAVGTSGSVLSRPATNANAFAPCFVV